MFRDHWCRYSSNANYSLYQAYMSYSLCRGIALLFLKLGTGRRWCGQHHAPADLPLVKTRYPLYKKLCGPQGRSGRVRKISPPPGIRSLDRPARSQSLYRLSYPAQCHITVASAIERVLLDTWKPRLRSLQVQNIPRPVSW
jgi:hypothetical protein